MITARTRTRSGPSASTNVPLAAPSSTARLRTITSQSFVRSTRSSIAPFVPPPPTCSAAPTAIPVPSRHAPTTRASTAATTSSPGGTGATPTSVAPVASSPSPSANRTLPAGLACVPTLRVLNTMRTSSPARADRGSTESA
ncbi:MAG TPA: hypothetical protein VGD01_17570 [Candidatus Elarobacter sp.]